MASSVSSSSGVGKVPSVSFSGVFNGCMIHVSYVNSLSSVHMLMCD